MSNVVPLRPTPPRALVAPVIDPPDPEEIRAARLYDLGYFTVQQFTRVCGDQIRAGRALDMWLRQRGPG